MVLFICSVMCHSLCICSACVCFINITSVLFHQTAHSIATRITCTMRDVYAYPLYSYLLAVLTLASPLEAETSRLVVIVVADYEEK